MVVIVSPVVQISTKNNRERFLSLLQDVADETLHREPNCLGYCWLVSGTEESTTVRGLEIYTNEEALIVTHRAGEAYQKFRSALSAERLAPPPKPDDLVFWHDTEWEFRQSADKKLSVAPESQCRIVTTEYKVDDPQKIDTLSALLKANLESKSRLGQLLYTVSRADGLERLLVVEAYTTEEAYRHSRDLEPIISSKVNDLVEEPKVEIWKPSGVGFVR